MLAERQHVADRAQRSSVRRRGGDGGSHGGARTLGDAVAFHLRSLNVDPDVEWDAWRREDGRWALTATTPPASAAAPPRSPTTPPAATSSPTTTTPAGCSASRWPAPTTAPARDDLSQARERRLTLGPAPTSSPSATTRSSWSTRPTSRAASGAEQPVEAYLDEPPDRDVPVAEDDSPAADIDAEGDAVPDPEPETDEPAARRPAKKKGRASVPSWDEIMFGGGKSE